jgi:PTS system mannose-specific IID component
MSEKKKNGIFDVSAEDKKMLDKIYWRSFMVFSGFAGAAYAAAPGYTFSIMPALVRWYPEKEKLSEAMGRHTTWYNITQNVGTFAMGLSASMEHENALHYGEYDTSAIVSIKTSLMGPMSGIGDALFWGILRVIAAGIGINIGMTGSPMGAILFFLIYQIPSMICRYYMTYLGYTMGESFIKQAFETGLIGILTKCAGIVGLMMVGYMISSNVSFNLAISIPVEGGDPIQLQTYLDGFLQGLLPLLITFWCYHMLKDRNMNQNTLLFIIMIVGFLCGLVGIA